MVRLNFAVPVSSLVALLALNAESEHRARPSSHDSLPDFTVDTAKAIMNALEGTGALIDKSASSPSRIVTAYQAAGKRVEVEIVLNDEKKTVAFYVHSLTPASQVDPQALSAYIGTVNSNKKAVPGFLDTGSLFIDEAGNVGHT